MFLLVIILSRAIHQSFSIRNQNNFLSLSLQKFKRFHSNNLLLACAFIITSFTSPSSNDLQQYFMKKIIFTLSFAAVLFTTKLKFYMVQHIMAAAMDMAQSSLLILQPLFTKSW